MAITDIGIATNANAGTADYDTTVRITPASTPSAIYVQFVTQHLEVQKYIDVAIALETVPRGSDSRDGDGYGGWWTGSTSASANRTRWLYRRLSASDLTVSARDAVVPGYLWRASVNFTSTDPTSEGQTLRGLISDDSTWAYDSRKYDAVHLQVKVKTLYDDNGVLTPSEVAQAECYIGYIPEYGATAAYYRNSGLVIDYTAYHWNRSTDRWEAASVIQDGAQLVPADDMPWGQVRTNSRLVIPADKLTDVVHDGTISGRIRMNAAWRPSGMPFADIVFSGLQVQDQSGVSTPTLTLVAVNANGRVVVDVGDSGDVYGGAPASVKVKLKGHYLPCDTIVTTTGARVAFYPPIGGTSTIVAVGFDSTGQQRSQRATLDVTVDKPADGATFGSWAYEGAAYGETARQAVIPYGWTLSESGGPAMEHVKLAGRERPSAFYGEGGTRTMSFAGVACTEAGHGLSVTDLDALRAYAEAGVILYRDAQGHRAWVSVTGVSVEHSTLPSWLKRVTVDMEEVAP